MKLLSSRRGSAIVIVLGLMSFILVSALAFSAYMRFARLPSSYLRRTSSSRMLAKAALARAVEEIDAAVGNNPHPGVGTGASRGALENVWSHRVFMGGSNYGEQLMGMTVSPLTLEGLAYIPPALVNEARCFSRQSPSCKWRPLGYDVGRFCYAALNVSDFFDVNRLLADAHRSSSDQDRVSIAYLFEDREHMSAGQDAGAWEEFMDNFRTVDSKTHAVDFKGKAPLISIADLNLALGDKGPVGDFDSPFVNYIRGQGQFYGSGTQRDFYRRMTFVTDGLFVPEETDTVAELGAEGGDLADPADQPFAASLLDTRRMRRNPPFSTISSGQNEGGMKFAERLSGLGCANLFDYLDTDHIPYSLAFPTTERVAMVCAVKPRLVGKFVIQNNVDTIPVDGEAAEGAADTPESRRRSATVYYKLDGSQLLSPGDAIEVLTAFPFAHEDEDDSSSFSLDGRISFFLSTEEVQLRATAADPNKLLLPANVNAGEVKVDAGFIECPVSSATKIDPLAVVDRIAGAGNKDSALEAALQQHDIRLMAARTRLATYLKSEANALVAVKYTWTQTKNEGGVATETWSPSFKAVHDDPAMAEQIEVTPFPMLKATGAVDGDFAEKFAAAVKTKGSVKVHLNAAVWLRVKDDQENVVDLVPACYLDDKQQNPRMNTGINNEFVSLVNSGHLPSGKPCPLLRFDLGTFDLSIENLEKWTDGGADGQTVTPTPKAALVPDPRFNFAPESWFGVYSDGKLSELWFENNFFGEDGRDADFFMTTSDAGYMQSAFEVAHLPRFTNLYTHGTDLTSGNVSAPSVGRTKLGGLNEVLNRDFMWRSYSPFPNGSINDREAFEEISDLWRSGQTGFKVNPYSDTTNILMAALANTPLDWKRASTNRVAGANVCYADLQPDEFNADYAWNQYENGTDHYFKWTELERVAGRIIAEMTNGGNDDWRDIWSRKMGWSYDDDDFCGPIQDANTAKNLWSHDRKFLYGFWRDCFAVRQQLFLIFVRAEPMMMGSGMSGQIPPQLGARAVALVWRDPTPTRDNSKPHRTRLLFYRQLD